MCRQSKGRVFYLLRLGALLAQAARLLLGALQLRLLALEVAGVR